MPRSGGYYLDDGPGANPPADLDSIPDAVPRVEPLRPANARPYMAMGVSYRPMTALEPYRARGLATWYGRRYHGKPTASGEPYDMYAMTGAHTTLPIPSYARVTNIKTGKSVVIRVNDRGPFWEGRVIDVSYTAAHKLGILAGATMVEVEAIIPGDSGPALITTQAPARPPAQPPERVVATPLLAKENQPARPLPAAETQAAAPAAAPPPPAAPVAPNAAAALPNVGAATQQSPVTDGRVFLQLGAFGSRENADAFLARTQSQADWLPLQVVTRDGLHRVQAGPYADQGAARQAADRVAEALGIRPFVQTR